MRATGIPGIAIAVVFKDEVVFAKGFGVREVGKADPVDADTVFQLASVSKPIGSTVVAALVGERLLSWDSRISDLDPGFEMHDAWVTREITVRDFYCHRSGLPDHAGDLLEDLGYTREEVLKRLRYQKPDTSFRSGYAYTNFGITEGAVAAAKAAGKDWEDVSEEKLYVPLGMTSTSSRYQDFVARENRALGHVQIDGKWVQKYQREPDAQSPAGGVSSSVNDMAKWMRLQLAGGKFEGKEIVKEEALAQTHHPHMLTGFSPLDGLPGFYGLGWNVSYDQEGRLRLSHSGGFDLGAATNVCAGPCRGPRHRRFDQHQSTRRCGRTRQHVPGLRPPWKTDPKLARSLQASFRTDASSGKIADRRLHQAARVPCPTFSKRRVPGELQQRLFRRDKRLREGWRTCHRPGTQEDDVSDETLGPRYLYL